MRLVEVLLLTVIAFLLGLGFGTGPGRPSATVHGTSDSGPRAFAAAPRAAGSPSTRTGRDTAPGAPEPRHERLARRADAGDGAATVELLGLLETCTLRDETRDFLRNHLDAGADDAPSCGNDAACADVDGVYDELDRALAQWRGAEADCAAVPEDWLRTRGLWLERLAAAGDTEARVCYALAGAELAPPPQHPDWNRWMDAWRRQGPPWAWDAWQRGDARAALALARIYGPNVLFGGANELAAADVRIAWPHALLLTRALGLDPATSDVAALAAELASSFTPGEQADAAAWVDAQLARVGPRLHAPSRLPDACWQHFAMFEAPADAAVARIAGRAP